MFTAILNSDRGLVFSAGPPHPRYFLFLRRAFITWLGLLSLATAQAEIPTVEIPLASGIPIVLPGPAPDQVASFLDGYGETEREKFLEKRELYVRKAASGLDLWYGSLARLQWLRWTLDAVLALPPQHPLTEEVRALLIQMQVAELDQTLFDNVDMVLEATQIGLGVSVGGYLSGGFRGQALGVGQSVFLSADYSPWTKKRRVRMGIENERLRFVEPFLLGTGFGIRVFIYVTVPDYVEENGRFVSPLIGPSFMKTDKTVAVSKWAGLSLSTPFPLMVRTDITRTHADLRRVLGILRAATSACASGLLWFAGRREVLANPIHTSPPPVPAQSADRE